MSRVIERLEGHARRCRAVPDDRHRVVFPSGVANRLSDAERRRNRGAGVPGTEYVVGAFTAAQKPADAIGLLDPSKPFQSPGERFVAVGLMADIPYETICGRIKNVMQANG